MTASPYRLTYPGIDRSLRQCEILSNVVRARMLPETLGQVEPPAFKDRVSQYAVVLTQDCDLEQDYSDRFPAPVEGSAKLIQSVLLCEVVPAVALFGQVKKLGSKAWDRVRQNNDVRYHFLESVDAGCDTGNEGLEELAIDFKQYFSVPTDELYRRIELEEARRRTVLASPYLEHLSVRFAHFLCRIALPNPHSSEPGGS